MSKADFEDLVNLSEDAFKKKHHYSKAYLVTVENPPLQYTKLLKKYKTKLQAMSLSDVIWLHGLSKFRTK
jgi:hypothetical protein